MPRLGDGITPYEVTSNGKTVEQFGARYPINNRVTGQVFKGLRFGFKTRPEAKGWRDYEVGLARSRELGQKQKTAEARWFRRRTYAPKVTNL